MSRIAPAAIPPLPAKGLAIELVEVGGNWSPPKGVTSVMMELNGAGQGGDYFSGSGGAYGGQAGDVINRVVTEITEATVFQVVVGTGGLVGNSTTITGGPGGDTTVTVKGVTHTALGGGKSGNRRGARGNYYNGSAPAVPPAYSILLGAQSPGFGTVGKNGTGGCSPLGFGSDGGPAGLGAGGAINSTPGGKGYVLFGYYLP